MDLKVGVAGATGALGAEILKVLDKAPWRPKVVVPSASARTAIDAVSYGESRLTVEDLATEELGELDLLILAVPPAIAQPIVSQAIADGLLIVDASASLPGVPLVVPWINPEVLADARAVAVPDGPALLLASILGPLGRAGIAGEVDATVLVPASAFGKSGIDELSKAVVALFNSGTAPRKIFDGGLAFDLAPVVGGGVTEAGWTDRELSTSSAVRILTGWEGEIRITLVLAPLFSGLSATVSLRPRRRVLADLALRVLADGGARIGGNDARAVPRPRKVEGRPFAHVGRVRASPAGDHLSLWITMDNLHTAAVAAVGAAGAMVRRTG